MGNYPNLLGLKQNQMHTVDEEPFSTATKRKTFFTVGTTAKTKAHVIFHSNVAGGDEVYYANCCWQEICCEVKHYNETSLYPWTELIANLYFNQNLF